MEVPYVFIYALKDPKTGQAKYVGKASDPYVRYEAHLDDNYRQTTHKAKWIRSLASAGQNPILEVLDKVPATEWQMWEQEWIRLFRALGFKLTNGTDGGDGVKATPATREKMGLWQRGLVRGRLSPEHKEKLRAALKGRPAKGRPRKKEGDPISRYRTKKKHLVESQLFLRF